MMLRRPWTEGQGILAEGTQSLGGVQGSPLWLQVAWVAWFVAQLHLQKWKSGERGEEILGT